MHKDKRKIAVINYGAGNLGSVVNTLTRLGYQPSVTDSVFEVLKADVVFLPGVGAAGDTMKGLEAIGMVDAVKKLVAWRRPLFAICVGLRSCCPAPRKAATIHAWTSYPVRSRNCLPD